jgi:hypothetical protein
MPRIRQKMITKTEDAVLRASNGSDRRDYVSTERRIVTGQVAEIVVV